ncbi:MAG: hypothetical protein ABSG53_03820 [Thermoguttaceae bacterium]|jgi:hypothetical protein
MLLAPEGNKLSTATTADLRYRIATTKQEREAAFRLVYSSYLRSGLGEVNDYRMRVTPYHLLPTTEIFIAELRGEVIFTMSLVIDGDLGVPMEKVYGEEIARLRRQGLRVAEVSCLADRRSDLVRFFPIFLRTSRVLVQYAHRQGLDALVVAVHPKHARFYRRYFDFRVIGEQKDYPTVRNHPAVALWMEFARLDRECPASYRALLAEPLDEEQLRPHPISIADCAYFRPMVDPTFQCAPIGDAEDEARDRSTELAACVA